MMKYVFSLLLVFCGVTLGAAPAGRGVQTAVLDAYGQRLPMLSKQIAVVTAAAAAAADLLLAEPRTGLLIPAFPGSLEFANEMTFRAGGLAKALSSSEVQATGVDKVIVLVSVRDWEQEGAVLIPAMTEYRRKGYFVIVFGSRVGCPTEEVWDALLDNGASETGINSGQVNIIANVTLGWMWCCEYTAALSRKGKFPGILKSIGLQGADENNVCLQNVEGHAWLGDTSEAVPAGHLAEIYLQRLNRLVADIHSPHTQSSISKAADVMADRLKAGKTVQLSGMGHVVDIEMLRNDLKTPFEVCRIEKFGNGLTKDDLAVWIGYIGNVGLIKTNGMDRLSVLRETGAQMVWCEAPMPAAGITAPDVLAQVRTDRLFSLPADAPVIATVNQSWSMPDADVSIPWAPGYMAPVSGINALLMLRTLDEQVAERLVVPAL